jgi:hypothetical protein
MLYKIFFIIRSGLILRKAWGYIYGRQRKAYKRKIKGRGIN